MRVLSVGRLHVQKGHAVLLRALAACRERGVRLSLAVVGEGPLRAELEGLSRRLGVESIVQFLGPRDDVLCLLRGCDLFAFPSLYEAFGVALLEAMACGKPVVAARAGGVSEVVEDGVSGILVPPGDAEALARAMAALAGDPSRRSALGRAARRRAEAFDITRTVRRLEDVYVRVLSGSEG